METKDKKKEEVATDIYPGAAVDKADNEHVDSAEIKERTKAENNNPRDHDLF